MSGKEGEKKRKGNAITFFLLPEEKRARGHLQERGEKKSKGSQEIDEKIRNAYNPKEKNDMLRKRTGGIIHFSEERSACLPQKKKKKRNKKNGIKKKKKWPTFTLGEKGRAFCLGGGKKGNLTFTTKSEVREEGDGKAHLFHPPPKR